MSYEIEVGITFISPHAQDGITDVIIDSIMKPKTKRQNPFNTKEDAIKGCYYRPDKYIGIPRRNIKSCLLEACSMTKMSYNIKGQPSIYPYVNAAIFIKEGMPSLGVKKPDDIERFPVRDKKRGTTKIKHRAVFNTGRNIEFTLLVIDDNITPEQVRVLMDNAGLFVGLGAGRPEYGRFEITDGKWKVAK